MIPIATLRAHFEPRSFQIYIAQFLDALPPDGVVLSASEVVQVRDALLWADNSLSHVLAGRAHRAIGEVHASAAAALALLDSAGED